MGWIMDGVVVALILEMIISIRSEEQLECFAGAIQSTGYP